MKKLALYTLLPAIVLTTAAPQAISKAQIKAGALTPTEPVAASLVTGTNSSGKSARETTTLRCWQEGKLLFEESHLKDSVMPGKARVFNSEVQTGNTSKIHLFESGTATCMYKEI